MLASNTLDATATPVERLIELRNQIIELGEQIIQQYQPGGIPNKSTSNLAHYLAMRRFDLRELQEQLAEIGASSLGRNESHVLTTLERVITLLQQGAVEPVHNSATLNYPGFTDGKRLLKENSKHLFGPLDSQRNTRIMVTLPSEAATDPQLVLDMMQHGMNCARINCAHDDRPQWQAMVENIKRARQATGKECSILMDLAGQKLRTILHSSPTHSVKIKKGGDTPVQVLLRSNQSDTLHQEPPQIIDMVLTLPDEIHRQLAVSDRLQFRDSRDKKRQMTIEAVTEQGEWRASCEKNSLIELSTMFSWQRRDNSGKYKTLAKFILSALPSHQPELYLQNGNQLLLCRDASQCSDDPECNPARVGCNHPGIIDDLQPGHWVWFDDGKIGAVVEEINSQGALLTVQRLPGEQGKLRNDKGINFPDTCLQLNCLTDKDLRDLGFVCKYADMVGFSFVQCQHDMSELIYQLQRHNAEHMAIVAKIETVTAVKNLPEIIFSAIPHHCLGIMIARGDLAVELGWEAMVEIQEEILWICSAAHVPVIWATQVLERLCKKGHSTRPELTDAAMSGRADCVMLNKGPYILTAIDTLNSVLQRMQEYQYKKEPQLKPLTWLE